VLDIGTDTMLGMFITKDIVATAKAAVALRGVLDGADTGRIFTWLRPNDLVWNYWVNNYLLGKDPPAFDMLYWNADTTRLPAKFHADLLDIFAESRFLRPGAMKVLGRPVDIRGVTLDSYFCAGITDHIAQWKHVYRNMRAFGGDRTFVLGAAGHIQSIVNPPARAARRHYLLNSDVHEDAEAWLQDAQPHAGSWWPHWLAWLQERSGPPIDAPARVGSEKHPPIAAAPGTYVLE